MLFPGTGISLPKRPGTQAYVSVRESIGLPLKCTAGQSGLVHEIGTGERLPSVTDGKRMGDRRRKDGNGVRLQNTGIGGIVDAVSTSHFKPQQTAVTSRR